MSLRTGQGKQKESKWKDRKQRLDKGMQKIEQEKAGTKKKKKGARKMAGASGKIRSVIKSAGHGNRRKKKIHLQPQALNTKQKPLLLEGKSPCYVNRLFQVAGDQV